MSGHYAYELGAMAQARNYYAWLCDAFSPFLTGTVVEHGAGTGLLSDRLRRHPMRLVLVEPDAEFHHLLRERFGGPETEVFRGTIEDLHRTWGDETADTVVSANVLEHVPDDVECLRAIARLLKMGGHLCLYVPARPELFGTLDERFEHCRRYDRKQLVAKIESVGLRVVSAQYRNLVGALGWWLSGRLLKTSNLNEKQVRFYDSYVFPITSRIESRWAPPYGQNLLVVATR
ncbi:MAG TPA: class I SAM-dependent methyltransferase [Polyangia bacterium]|jgi:SAM-dependent methyltransferase|nr:class I SAM-dependent methyltransferase [Polyangia bacterium]